MTDSTVEARSMTRRRVVTWIVLTVVAVIVFVVAWVGIRGLLAVRDLQSSVTHVATLRAQIADANSDGARRTAGEFQDRADGARSLTSDPIWRTAEVVPLVGPDLRAVRQISNVVATVADGSVRPAIRALGKVNTTAFRPKDGRIDVAAIASARPSVDRAAVNLHRALEEARAIDTTDTLSVVDKRVDQLVNTLAPVDHEADVARRVIDLAPSMLGTDGARNYLLLVENNAELRAGGGIAGSVVLLHADDGKISLTQQASGASFPRVDQPVLPLTTETQGLYGAITGQYMLDTTLTPRFATTAKLASAFWQQRFGQKVDGVVSIDPVTLGYLLNATGPVKLATGDTLTSDNAVAVLLSQVYARYSDPAMQDAFFASAASSVFNAVTSGSADPAKLVTALSRGAAERRIMVWSSRGTEQRRIVGTSAAGGLPVSTQANARFGVYLNDATGAKMDYYLTKQIAVGSKVCRADGRPTWTVQVTLKNTAPADAATSLPRYVTGGGDFGVSPGNVGTNVAIYAPRTGVFLSASQDGKAASPQTALDGRYPVVQIPTLLSPGQSTTLTVQFLGPKAAAGHTVAAESTPGVHQTVTRPVDVTCESR